MSSNCMSGGKICAKEYNVWIRKTAYYGTFLSTNAFLRPLVRQSPDQHDTAFLSYLVSSKLQPKISWSSVSFSVQHNDAATTPSACTHTYTNAGIHSTLRWINEESVLRLAKFPRE